MSGEGDVAVYEVGQRVWIKSVNARGREPKEARVIKVGRKLVTVDGSWYGGTQPTTYRIDGGHRNDQYGHEWIETDDQRAERDRADLVLAYLHEKRVYDLERIGLSCDALEGIAAIVRADLGDEIIPDQSC